MEIKFSNISRVPQEFSPQPASKFIPDWYKQLPSYLNDGEKKPNGDGKTTATIKRCMPVFDSINQGYIITTYCDIWVSQREMQQEDGTIVIGPYYEWPSLGPIQFHPIDQAPNHPAGNGMPYPKLINPWSIKTPPGYSTSFMAPVHRENIFTILPGVVDTDVYSAPVNFPMVLTDVKFEGLVPAGTPIAQVVPFKREEWRMSIGDETDIVEQENITIKLRTRFFDSYKTAFRQIKEYK
jgi:hypothetical protein